ncbi:NADH-FMN oxidoreductase RutF, flavin reductase (DIM6/NTAB) family [Pseudonocardia ammonioxydans]|uniref:NADH-FMN oxidoreductase RutF, flavin reductase (DIM6/NTAB) family n=1 Tax=Pseudonocardia ammonioxydans TaxID=260086 RepID=A0A1I5HEN3_PSUAM|nr:flavin reductase family protein [Pseudonocardia ammonioxydans]SFO46520.1 NADH-FMN oxidoreductase RutF, flavin reductase (DIM6/NTAB) family [Pseudonocardia ammonioxydans]
MSSTEALTTASSLPAERFKAAMADLPAAVAIVTTTAADGAPRGATVSAVSSLSLDPPLLLVCLDQRSDTLAALTNDAAFLVHVAADGQQEHALRMASKGSAKFDDALWSSGLSAQPQLRGATAVFDCRVADLIPAGDHVIVIGAVRQLEHDPDRHPVIYHRRRLAPAPQTDHSNP